MEERKRDADDSTDEEASLENGIVVVDDVEVERDAEERKRGKKERSTLWMFLAATSTLMGRRLLTTGFPYPICLVALLQLAAYVGVAIAIPVIKLKEIRNPHRECVSGRKYSWSEYFIVAGRFCAVVILSTAATIFGAEALMHYTTLPVLALLPIFTYVLDSLLFRLAHAVRISRSDEGPTRRGLYRVSLVFACVFLVVYEDYRLNPKALLFAFAAFSLVSMSKLIPRIGPRIENGSVHTWDCPFYVYLLCAIPSLIITIYAACKFEDISSAAHIVWSRGGWVLLFNLAPGTLHLIIFNSSMNMAYPSTPKDGDDAPSILEDSTSQAKTAIATTLQVSFWVTCIGVFLGERNLVDWVQVLAATLLYVMGAGPRKIGFYPPRIMNLIARILRKPQQKITGEPWQLPFFLWITVSIFIALFSSSLLYWNVNVAYGRDTKTWTGPAAASLDNEYVHAQPYLLDIVIAHSEGDPIESIKELISTFATVESIQANYPRIQIYTKDPSLTETNFSNFTGAFTGPLTSTVLHNTGGITATFLHHILYSWDSLPSQTLFLSTSSPLHLSRTKSRFDNYFVPTLPIHSERVAEPITSFLNLGEYESCHCGSCSDTRGWNDTLHLISSMWGAARPGAPQCDSVLLTYGNNFVVSAGRIRGLPRDVWQMLYDALVTEDLRNAWAHNAKNIPTKKDKGKWMFGEEDSVQNPYLGYTVERLWGILLQCSTSELAWRCPSITSGWRGGGANTDCGCLHW